MSNLSDILKQDIRKSYGKSELQFMDLSDKVSESSNKVQGSVASQVLSLLNDIVTNADTDGLDELKTKVERLTNLKRYIGSANLGPEEKSIVDENYNAVSKAIKNQYGKKRNLLRRAGGAIKDNTTNLGALLIGATGGDPLAALGVKIVGDMMDRRRDKKQQIKQQRLEKKREDQSSLAQAAKTPGSTPGSRPTSTPSGMPGLGGFGGGDGMGDSPEVLGLLESILEESIKTVDNTNELVRVARLQERMMAELRLDKIEADREKLRPLQSGSGTGTSEEKKESKMDLSGFIKYLPLLALGIPALLNLFGVLEGDLNSWTKGIYRTLKVFGKTSMKVLSMMNPVTLFKTVTGAVRTGIKGLSNLPEVIKGGKGLIQGGKALMSGGVKGTTAAIGKGIGSAAMGFGAKLAKGGAKAIPGVDMLIDGGFGAYQAEEMGVGKGVGTAAGLIAGDKEGGFVNALFNAWKWGKMGAIGGGIGGAALGVGAGAIPGAIGGGIAGAVGGFTTGMFGAQTFADMTKDAPEITERQRQFKNIMEENERVVALLRKQHDKDPERLKAALAKWNETKQKRLKSIPKENQSNFSTDQIFDAFAQAETGNMGGGTLDPSRFIRTFSEVDGEAISTAYGPVQITSGLVKGHLKNGTFANAEPEIQDYVNRFLAQGQKFHQAGEEKGGKYGRGGPGDLATDAKDRQLYYKMAAIIMASESSAAGGGLEALVARWRFGHTYSVDRAKSEDPAYFARFNQGLSASAAGGQNQNSSPQMMASLGQPSSVPKTNASPETVALLDYLHNTNRQNMYGGGPTYIDQSQKTFVAGGNQGAQRTGQQAFKGVWSGGFGLNS